MAKFLYFKTLKESFKQVFKNYQLFVPLILNILFGLATIPFYTNFYSADSFSTSAFVLMMLFVPVSAVAGFLLYGWLFALVRNVAQKKKINLTESFSEGLSLAWKYFKVMLALMLLLIIAAAAIGLITLVGFLLYLIPVVGIVLIVIVILLIFFLFLVALLALFYLTPIMILEKGGAFDSINLSYHFFMKHKGHTIKMGLITFVLLILAYLPALSFQFRTIFASFQGQLIQPTIASSLYAQLLSIPVHVLSIIIIMFYCLAYIQLKNK